MRAAVAKAAARRRLARVGYVAMEGQRRARLIGIGLDAGDQQGGQTAFHRHHPACGATGGHRFLAPRFAQQRLKPSPQRSLAARRGGPRTARYPRTVNRVATLGLQAAGVTVIAPSGEIIEQVFTGDPLTTNVCFGGPDMSTAYLTLSGTGRLVSMPWRHGGLRLNFN